ncbi:prenyltransferase [Mumia sp. Pv 4-285]|uniref:prenyltransferase n=1 Tax=Mumia qirimensis TaxID=3234852 RepID=UPI00351CBFE1
MSAATIGSEGRGHGTLVTVLGSSRPLSWVNTAYPFGAAYLLAGGGVDLAFLVGVLYFLVPYNLLMYGVNDVFDYESDVHNPRKGGVEGVVLDRDVHRSTIVIAAVANIPFLVALVVLGTPVSNALLAVAVLAVLAYSVPVLRFKERPLLDSLTSSTHFVAPACVGVAMTGASPASAADVLAAFFVWGVGSHAFGAVQDIEADRAGGIASVATWLGAAGTVRLALAAYVVAGLLLLTLEPPYVVAAVLAVPYVLNVAPYVVLTDADCERAHAGWRRFLWLNYLTGFLVTQLLIWAALGW